MKKLILAIIIAPFLSLIFIGVHVFFIVTSPYEGNKKFFQIDEGDTFGKINFRLHKEGLIENPRVFHYYAKATGDLKSFKIGTYEITQGMSMLDILALLKSGKGILNTITIPEGKNIYEIASLLKENNIIESENDFITSAKSSDMIELTQIPQAPSVEGFLYPETYKFAPNSSANHIIKTMIKQFFKVTEDLQMNARGLSTYELLTLASIVEKETGAPSERKTIAGVYHNRLIKKMRLQADPTTIYGIYDRDGSFNGNIRKQDLLTPTPYNTYKISGLPKGPICNPGVEAIKATINPEEHNFLYFVSKNDGTHVFTPSYKLHLEAVRIWQQTKKNRTGKSWRDLNQ